MKKIIATVPIILALTIVVLLAANRQGEEANEPRAGVTVIADNIEIPWDIAFLPDGSMLVTERGGNVLALEATGGQKTVFNTEVEGGGEGGLLGIALHPNFADNRFVYLYMTRPASGGQTGNRVVRYRYENEIFSFDKVIINGIPGAIYHDGGRIAFGPNGMLYISTGDATEPRLAQDLSSLAGKILRLRDDGALPSDNPFGTAIYSYGHRNPQGLAWDSEGRLFSTEHGRSGALSGLDEINFIQAGTNYGWPDIEGDQTKNGMVNPILHSGARTTWAPASAAILNGSIFFGGLRGEALYEAILDGERVRELKTHFEGEFGRIRTVRVGPDEMLYLSTSNRDGRGSPAPNDDKIIRVNPKEL
ncbi:MAG: PQQ-dependent sugar dehydrogenase [bacterium]|nr:PQQ-dependent sugar dehydrogenase [bacterium]